MLVVVLAMANAAYWFMFSINAYNTFHEYSDLGGYAYDMYYHIHFPNIVGGLQYLVFSNHIAPDLLMMLPVYAIFQSALTLVFVQALALSVTGFVLFFVARNLLKDSRMALLLALAYFLNPGVHSMLITDFHAESLIILFYLLTFYFYTKKERGMMLVSLMLLLGSMEVAPFLAVMLGLGLILYEFLHDKDKLARKENIRSALIIIIISTAVLLVYALIAAYLTSAYASGYVGLPNSIRVWSIDARELNNLIGVLNGTRPFENTIPETASPYYLVSTLLTMSSLVVVFLGFGIASLMDPIIGIVLTSPWLVEVFIMGNLAFIVVWNWYASFALGGAIVATLLSMKRFTEPRKNHAFFRAVFVSSILVFCVLLSVMAPWFVRPEFSSNPIQSFLFQVNATQKKVYSDLNYIIEKIPPNASLMAPDYTAPHLYARRYFETLVGNNHSIYQNGFTPQYILIDLNESIRPAADVGSNYDFFSQGYSRNYQLYAKNGTAELYKLG